MESNRKGRKVFVTCTEDMVNSCRILRREPGDKRLLFMCSCTLQDIIKIDLIMIIKFIPLFFFFVK